MKGVVLTGNKKLEIREFPKPRAGEGQIVVKIKVAAVCGSDLHHYRREPKPGEVLYISGHEPCGVVEEIGNGVSHVKPGQRVALYHYQGCGVCENCAAGLFQHCPDRAGFGNPRLPGCDADYLLCNAVNAVPLPDELSFIDGAFAACIAGTSFSALNTLNLNIRTNLCIYGLGPVGLTALKLAKAMCPRKIVCVDPNPERRSMAHEIGADLVLDSNEDTVRKIQEFTNGGADCSIETSGSVNAQKSIIESAAQFGKIAVVGFSSNNREGIVNLSSIIVKSLTIIGSFVTSLPEFHQLLKFLVDKDIHFESLVTHRFPLEKAEEAFQIFDKGDTGKVIFEF